MRVDIITLFPDICSVPLHQSITGRALKQEIIDLRVMDLREFTHDKHRTADDRPYGGGPGMVLKPEPVFEAVEELRTTESHVLLLTPQGEQFTQKKARRLAENVKHLIMICGHYEGVDDRIRQKLIDEEVSIGDYVLTNGTIAAVVVADAVIRLLPGVLGCRESTHTESFGTDKMLDYPQYTRPSEFRGMKVPRVLLSGNHAEIAEWRNIQRIRKTQARRPDLLRRRHAETENEQTPKNSP